MVNPILLEKAFKVDLRNTTEGDKGYTIRASRLISIIRAAIQNVDFQPGKYEVTIKRLRD